MVRSFFEKDWPEMTAFISRRILCQSFNGKVIISRRQNEIIVEIADHTPSAESGNKRLIRPGLYDLFW